MVASDQSEDDESKTAEFEDFLLMVGTRSRRNIFVMCMASLTGMILGMNVFSYQFIGATPDFKCTVGELANETDWTSEQIQNISSPLQIKDDKEEFSTCVVYKFPYSKLISMSYEDATSSVREWTATSNETIPCERKFEEGDTIVTKWDLVCERRYLYTWTQGGAQLGLLIGSIIMGYLIDRFGRKTVYNYCVIIFLLSGGLSIGSPNVELFIFLRVISAATALGFYLAFFVLAMESCLSKERSFVGTFFIIPWAIGMMITPGIAKLVTQWRYLQLALSFPALLLIINFWVVPESVRWLVMNGFHSKAYKELKVIADANGRVLPDRKKIIQDMKTIESMGRKPSDSSSLSKMERFKKLCRHLVALLAIKKLRLQTLLVFYCWFAAATVYYGVSLGAPGITDNAYLYLFIGGVLELVSYLALAPTIQIMGRRVALIMHYAITAFSIFGALGFIVGAKEKDYYTLKLILYLVGKFAITSAFQLIWVWTAELYPTKFRSLAIGESSTVGRLGSIFSPFINDLLSEVRIWIPAFLFGTFSLLAIFCSYYLKDTTNQNLNENLQDDPGIDNPAFDKETNRTNSVSRI